MEPVERTKHVEHAGWGGYCRAHCGRRGKWNRVVRVNHEEHTNETDATNTQEHM